MTDEPGKKPRKVRAEFRKNREVRARDHGHTRRYAADQTSDDEQPRGERVSAKGHLSRKRTIIVSGPAGEGADAAVHDVDLATCLPGRVLRVQGLISSVQAADGKIWPCATRRLLKTISTDQRHVVAAGDRVFFRPEGSEGIIERVEPRHGVLSRTSRGRQQVIVANVDQMLIVTSAAEPDLKPHLIDRFLVTAEKMRVQSVICVNKIDLVDPATLQPTLGVFAQMGYEVLQLSVKTGVNIDRLRQLIAGRQSVVAGQSGVGKSSLLNAVDPLLDLKTREVSADTEKGRHTTTTASLIPLSSGGYVVDTPGIRQFQLWDVIPAEMAGYFRDLRPLVDLCEFPDCTHTHEEPCAVKDAVADGRLDGRRYESYCHLLAGDEN
ncbi:MAG: ribosome small subunit-dependent GTPase A [Planctomycetia bacterium]|nr:ribosome small subunit-dependent GTPase A [Planctomycetia bacterium]